MSIIILPPYNNVVLGKDKTSCVDHLGGFDISLNCTVLDLLNKSVASAVTPSTVETEYIFTDIIKTKYNNLNLQFNVDLWTANNFIKSFNNYSVHPTIDYKNFIRNKIKSVISYKMGTVLNFSEVLNNLENNIYLKIKSIKIFKKSNYIIYFMFLLDNE